MPRLASIALASLSALVAVHAPARASPPAIATDAAPDTPHRLELRVGMLAGTGDVGDVTGASHGVHVAVGGRYGDLTGMAEYDYLTVGDDDGVTPRRSGDLSRAGLTARYSIFHTGERAAAAVDYWAEAGVGYERVAWDPGGVLDRPDAVLGFGVELDGHPYWQSPQPRHLGMWLGFRAIVARAPATGEPAMCGGPCTMATSPSRNDAALYFTFGVLFGR